MTSGKAQHNAPQPLSERLKADANKPLTFKSNTRTKLKELYENNSDIKKQSFDYFIDSLLLHVLWAKDELDDFKSLLSKADLLAEHEKQLKAVEKNIALLNNISPEYDRLLGIEPVVEECLDSLRRLELTLEESDDKIKNQDIKPKIDEYRRNIFEEFSIRALQVLADCDIKIAGTGCDEIEYKNVSVDVLKVLSEELNIYFSKLTLRDYVVRAKNLKF